jgi:predicted nucleotidyltransferase
MAAIEDVVNQIAMSFHPKSITLFGSYAYGEPGPQSDVDLLVVMETQLSGARQAALILQAISYRFGMDLLVYTPQNLATRLAWGDPFLKEITGQGRVLYGSPHS